MDQDAKLADLADILRISKENLEGLHDKEIFTVDDLERECQRKPRRQVRGVGSMKRLCQRLDEHKHSQTTPRTTGVRSPNREVEGSRPFTVIRCIVHSLFALCFVIIPLCGVSLAALAFTLPQGRDVLIATLEGPSAWIAFPMGYFAFVGTSLFATLLAARILHTYSCSRDVARVFAAALATGCVALIACGGVPFAIWSHLEMHNELTSSRANYLETMATAMAFPFVLIHAYVNAALIKKVAHGLRWRTLFLIAVSCLALTAAVIIIRPILFLLVGSVLLVLFTSIVVSRSDELQESTQIRDRGLRLYGTMLVCLGSVACVVAVFSPNVLSVIVSSFVAVFLATGLWIGLGVLMWNVVSGFYKKRRAVPFIFAAVGISVTILFFMTGPLAVTEVRTLPPDESTVTKRETSSEYAQSWLSVRKRAIEESKYYPVFIVTAEGGGIRAAYWTASSLAALDDFSGGAFGTHTFGISGVSGGSLGAAVFVSQMSDRYRLKTPFYQRNDGLLQAQDEFNRSALERQSARILGHDFLSPTINTLLFSAPFRTTIRITAIQDRTVALEKAFEIAWRKGAAHQADGRPSTTFEERFDKLWAGHARYRVPMLFLNGTHRVSGKPVVMTGVGLGSTFPENADLQAMLGVQSVRVSTAVMMSARFPYISTVGRLPSKDNSESPIDIVDGGYFDTSGSATASAILKDLLAAAARIGVLDKIRPVVLSIRSAPRDEAKSDESSDGSAAEDDFPVETWGMIFEPIRTINAVWQNNSAMRHEKALELELDKCGGKLLIVTIKPDTFEYPLGWMLSNDTRDQMHRQLRKWRYGSKNDFDRVHLLMKRSSVMSWEQALAD